MNKFKIGDKVETPFGVGVIYNSDEGVYSVEIKANNVIRYADFFERELKPYKSAHDKLLELGFKLRYDDKDFSEYFKPKTIKPMFSIFISKKEKEYWLQSVRYRVDLELSKILTQYLEELEEHEKE